MPALILAGIVGISWVVTDRVRKYAERRQILDLPNSRSLHSRAIPRGGGLGFVSIILLGLAVLWYLFPMEATLWLSLLGSVLVAITGWLDDRLSLSSALRIVIHGLGGLWVVIVLGGLSTVRLGLLELELGVFGGVITWLFVVWLINAYNFMDGIDGLAAGQAVLAGSVAALLSLSTPNAGLTWFAALVAASCAGFLRWNLPPARLFMGDTGSGFLGYVFAVLALYSESSGGPPLLVWLLLLGVFLVDPTATLLRRLVTGEPWHQAHRTHAYQRAVQLGYSHRFVMVAALTITLVLGLAAWAVNSRPALALPTSVIAFGLLLLIWWHVVRQPLRSEAGGLRSDAVSDRT
ncbi:MAG: glycosyltransferase family 4 protein [Trueperaceae bacterium]